MGFAIICDARAGESLGIDTLALVDRAKTRRQWWTSDEPGLILDYKKRSAAEFACRRLKHNSARVVTTRQALEIIYNQMQELDRHEAMDCAEAGWDGHKGHF